MARIKLKYVHSDVDRHGNVRHYFFRRGMTRKVRLRGQPGSDEFMAAYAAALAGRPIPPRTDKGKLQRAPLGTLEWLCNEHYQSAEFKSLARGTQENRRGILRQICREALSPCHPSPIGELPFGQMSAKAVRMLRDRKSDTPNAANNWVGALRVLYSWAIAAEHADHNPAKDVPKIHVASDGHHTWTVEEIERYETTHPIGTQARLSLAMLIYTGQRRADVVALGRQHLTDRGTLRFTQKKNETRDPVTVEIPMLPELSDVIDRTPSGQLTFLVTEAGNPWSPKGFGNRFRQWCNEAGLPHCSAHGIRKAAACVAAERGATEMQLMAIFGWRDPDMARVYTRRASRSKMASEAMGLLGRANKGGTNVSHFPVQVSDGGRKNGNNA